MPNFNDLNATSAGGYTNANQDVVNQAVSNIGPFASTYQVPTFNTPQLTNTGTASSGGALDQFFNKVGSVFSESAHMFESAVQWTGRQLVDMGKSAVNELPSIGHFAMDAYHTINYGHEQQNILDQMTLLGKQYNSGQISSSQYGEGMKQLIAENTQLGQRMQGLTTKIGSDGGQVIHNTIGTAADVITIMTAGLTSPLTLTATQGAKDTASFLTSRAADALMNPAEDSIRVMAGNAKIFNSLPEYIQNNVRASVTDTFMNAGANLTQQQVARATVTNLALKYPLAFNYLSGTGEQLYKEFSTGKYGDGIKTLGFNALLLLSGGPIGQAFKYGGNAVKGLSGKLFGSTSFLDELSSAAGYHANALFMAIQHDPELIKSFQALEATNMAAEQGRAVSAAYRIVNGLKADSPDIFGNSPEEFVQNVHNWYAAQKDLTDTMTTKIGSQARNLVVGRWAASTKNWVASQLTKPFLGGTYYDSNTALRVWQQLKELNPNSAYALNKNLDTQITRLISESTSAEELDKGIRSIATQMEQSIPKSLARRLAQRGYVAITPSKLEAPFVEGTQKLSTKFLVTRNGGDSEFFTKAVQPMKITSGLSDLLTRAGLSPQRAQQSTYEIFSANLMDNLQNTSAVFRIRGESAESRAKNIMSKLQNYINEKNTTYFKPNLQHAPITDMRQLTTNEIQDSLEVSRATATEVAKAINQSMLSLSFAERGLAPKLTDYVQSLRPGAKLSLNGYLRVQGAGRFAWNPFFKMKLAAKTEILSSLEGRGFIGTKFDQALGLVFGNKYDLEGTVQSLESRGMFGGAGYSSEATNEEIAAVKGASGQVLRSQKLSIAGLISSQAERAGMNVPTFIDQYPNEVRDTVQAILHYNPRANFLNSPLARTLNFAFFPFRFNLKVATFMARSLARQDAITQVAIVHGMMQMHSFLTSEQGQVWYSKNSDVIGLLVYFTPIETLRTITALGNIGNESVGSFGELGGLPAGFIVQILQAEGMWNPSTPYLNPKTGQATPDYIPQTAKAKLASAIGSFIGSLFTYPGSTAGLPSKAKLDKNISARLTGAKANEWTAVTPTNLTPQQQQFQGAIQDLQSTGQGQITPTTQDQGFITPETGQTTAQPYYKKTGGSSAPSPRVKKNQEPLSSLPGQSVVGQV